MSPRIEGGIELLLIEERTQMSAMVEVSGLTKYFGTKRGVIDLSFAVAEGEVFGFLGPNGAGRTTTMRLLMALLFPTSGSAASAGPRLLARHGRGQAAICPAS